MNEPVERYRLLIADVYELAGLSRRMSGREASEHGATAVQWQVLSVLAEEAVTVPRIARRLGLTRQAVQRVVNDLRASGQVRGHPADGSAHSPRIESTVAGRKLLSELWRANKGPREQMLAAAAIGGEDLDAARATLRRLIESLRASQGAG